MVFLMENKWRVNRDCKEAIRKRNEARQRYLQLKTPLGEENYETERRVCKRNYMNELLHETEQDRTLGKIGTFS